MFCEKPPGMSVNEIKRVIKYEKNNPKLKLKYDSIIDIITN